MLCGSRPAYVHSNHVDFLIDDHSWLSRCRNFRTRKVRHPALCRLQLDHRVQLPQESSVGTHRAPQSSGACISQATPHILFKHLLLARHCARSRIINSLHFAERNKESTVDSGDFYIAALRCCFHTTKITCFKLQFNIILVDL